MALHPTVESGYCLRYFRTRQGYLYGEANSLLGVSHAGELHAGRVGESQRCAMPSRNQGVVTVVYALLIERIPEKGSPAHSKRANLPAADPVRDKCTMFASHHIL